MLSQALLPPRISLEDADDVHKCRSHLDVPYRARWHVCYRGFWVVWQRFRLGDDLHWRLRLDYDFLFVFVQDQVHRD